MLSTEIFVSYYASVWAPPYAAIKALEPRPRQHEDGVVEGLGWAPPWGVFIDFLTRLGQIVPPPSPPPAGDGGGVIGANFAPRVLGGPRRALERSWGGPGGPGGSWGGPGGVLGGSWEGPERGPGGSWGAPGAYWLESC